MIRILELLPSALKWSGIQTSLRAVPLDHIPVYEALSYTWGTELPVHRICCNGQNFAIRPNLFHALRRLRYRTKPRLLWIDAICIDQDNTDEKNLQIPLMRNIYMSASQVLV
ncbi:HET-domain-containing protein [Cenococcum geophilum 1.58]|uniref:HET-domain-containing protein n=1 Tax=Cenococcum geophilum 1.58 TaxID=794803 RepID=UPI00358E972F|nr:HET-domain-containing protein [Cenococcum geophilum 1.58]